MLGSRLLIILQLDLLGRGRDELALLLLQLLLLDELLLDVRRPRQVALERLRLDLLDVLQVARVRHRRRTMIL